LSGFEPVRAKQASGLFRAERSEVCKRKRSDAVAKSPPLRQLCRT